MRTGLPLKTRLYYTAGRYLPFLKIKPPSIDRQAALTLRPGRNASLTWEKGPASVTASVNYTGAFKITDPTFSVNCLTGIQFRADGAFGGALSPSVTAVPPAWYPYCSVHHFTDVNLYARYAATEHVFIHASITNLFNTEPPVDLQTYGGGGELAYNAALHQDGAVGRYFVLGATLKF